jgi:predicted amidohydrolase YtcJ
MPARKFSISFFGRGILASLSAISLLAACQPMTSASQPSGADLVLTGGKVRTESGWEEAVAISNGVIVAIGSDEEIGKQYGSAETVIDLGGQVVLPGFHDMHVHPLFSGLGFKCDIEAGLTMEAFRSALAKCVAAVEPGEWIVGRRWDVYALGVEPSRQLIDDISPDNPVFLNDTSGHSALVNSLALELAGITGETVSPIGGKIVVDERGEPSGVLHETSMGLVSRIIPPQYSKEEIEQALISALREMERYGITSFVEASTGFAAGLELEVEVYADLAQQGLLRQRSQLCLEWFEGTGLTVEDYIKLRDRSAGGFLSVDCIKIFLDGVPTSSHTAAMLQPYVDYSGGRGSVYGTVFVEQATLNAVVAAFDAAGFSVKFHAAGDAAVRAGLDAIKAAREENGPGGPMHSVGHCTFISQADMSRGPEIGATFEMSPYLWSPSPISSDIAESVGPSLIRDVWPVRSTLDAGSLVVPGSDWAVVPSVNPWIAVETLVTREAPGGSEASFGKRQAITVEEAIDLFTINSARHLGTEDKLGTIAVGKTADIIVVDQNPYEIEPTELHKTKVQLTIVEGKIVHSADAPP